MVRSSRWSVQKSGSSPAAARAPGQQELGRAPRRRGAPRRPPRRRLRSDRGLPAAERADQALASARSLGVAHEAHRLTVGHHRRHRGGSQRGGQLAGPLPAHDHRGQSPRDGPARGGSRGAQRLLRDRRLREQSRDQLASSPLPHAGRRRLLERITLGGGRGELVDVRENRFAEIEERSVRNPGGGSRLGHPPPGDAGAHAVRGEQGVERAALAVLAAAKVHVDAPCARALPARLLDDLEEARERPLHPDPDSAPELAGQRPRVGRDLTADRGDDLVGKGGEAGAEGRDDLLRQTRA